MKLTGTILDENNNPIAKANIASETNKLVFAATDSKGNFTIDSDIIIPFGYFKISHIGYKTKFVKANELVNAKIKLQPDIEILEQVNVVSQPKTTSKTIVTKTKSFKTPLIVIGSLSLIALGFYVIKKSL